MTSFFFNRVYYCVAAGGRKLCSFYLEGTCRHSNDTCRYSHDTHRITCRFWEGGTCFKDITCPFLHGYNE